MDEDDFRELGITKRLHQRKIDIALKKYKLRYERREAGGDDDIDIQAEEVDGDLRWSPSERTNFMAFLQATKCSITLLNFELNSSFYVAIPALLFGWFLYILELKQFHEFDGFSFDHFCDGNVTSEGGGGHHG